MIASRTANPRPRWPAAGKLLTGGIAAAGVAVLGLVLFTRRLVREVERMFPPGGRFIDVDGVRLHYVVRGQGPPLVLIHGLGGHLVNFAYLTDRLADEHRVILVDRPGAGYSSAAPRGKRGIRAQASLLAKFLRQLGLRQPVVVGHSFGGAVALALALDHPESVGALALTSPFTHPVRSSPWVKPALRALSLLCAPAAWTLVLPLARWRFRQEEILREVFRPEACPPDFEERAGMPLSVRPAHVLSAWSEMLAANDDLPGMAARYPGLRLPVSVLFGAGDNVLDPDPHGAALARAIPHARLDLVPGGHMIPVTVPGLVAGWIKARAREAAGDRQEGGGGKAVAAG